MAKKVVKKVVEKIPDTPEVVSLKNRIKELQKDAKEAVTILLEVKKELAYWQRQCERKG